ncbi:MAG: alpha/beta hydrolase [Acidobacteriaceae bacterium]|nr:alpha/beta hydrolase [Acidobacteriaceae bacterium]
MKLGIAIFVIVFLRAPAFTQQEPKSAEHEQQSGEREPKSVPHQRNLFAEPRAFPLWEHDVPGATGNRDEDNPTLTLYPSVNPRSSGTAVIVAPGGGYVLLAINHEGRQVANWLNSLGVTAFVLKYRLGPKYHHPIELGDAQRAVRLVRFRAKEFGIRPDRIGMMGFSAGGHLASTVGTHFDSGNPTASDPVDRVSCRPDFLVLAYPVISFIAPYSRSKSAQHLLGETPDPKLLEDLSNDLHVTPETPPTFLFSTSTDKVVAPQNSVDFYLALHKAGVPAEIHIFEKGPHGVGLDLADPVLGQWPTLLANWMRGRGLLGK